AQGDRQHHAPACGLEQTVDLFLIANQWRVRGSRERLQKSSRHAFPLLLLLFLLCDPGMRRVVVEYPGPLWTSHDVEIVEIVTVWRADRMIASRHQHHIAVFHAYRFIERAVVG